MELNDNNEEFCPPITVDLELQVNTTETSLHTVVGLTCSPGYVLSGDDVIICTEDGYWSRVIPRCKEEAVDGSTSGIEDQTTLIVICVLAILVALGVIVFAFYMMCQTSRRNKKQQSKEEAHERKMKEISMQFDAEVTEDYVGMPAYIFTNRNLSLKGRTHNSESSTDESGSPTATCTNPSTSETEVSIEHDDDRVFVY